MLRQCFELLEYCNGEVMKSLFDVEQAAKFSTSLQMRAYTSRLLGQSDDLVLHGGGNTSVKDVTTDIFGEEVEVLYVKGSGHDLKTIQENGFSPTRLNVLKRLAALSDLSDTNMMRELKMSQLDPTAPAPSVETLLHAIIPFRYVDHTHADSLVAISNTPNGLQFIKEIYGERFLILDYEMPGFLLSKQVHHATKNLDWSNCEAIILLHHGIFTFDDDAQKSYEKMIAVVSKAEDFLKEKGAWDCPLGYDLAGKELQCDAWEIAKMRKYVCLQKGGPLVGRYSADNMASLSSLEIAERGPITPDHVLHTKRIAMICTGDHEKDIQKYAEAYRSYFERNRESDALTCLDTAPRWALWKGKGRFVFAPNGKRLRVISDIIDHTSKCIQWGEFLGGWRALPEKDVFDLEYWELEQAKLKRKKATGPLEGQIAIVSGGASGIGRATVEELIQQGACVVGADISPSIKDLFTGHPSFWGVCCDMTNSKDVKKLVDTTVRHFGGVDILVSNAGVFPPSENIENLSDEHWRRSMAINLDSHFFLLRESIPFLRLAWKPSVVFVGSKNVKAPGVGVSSYSVAKAGLQQLARVATMELASIGVRVNTIHPDAVFDTGVWSDEVLQARAKKYGMSVADYKTRNLLKANITSKDVAQAIFILVGANLSATTGTQLTIDGGNERTL